jgi:hypothetical protein
MIVAVPAEPAEGDRARGVVVGRARIAHELGRSKKTVSRWIKRGVLPVTKAGPFGNSLLTVRVADLERLNQAAPQD